MMREEFIELLGAQISEKDYRIIENVYTWHPIFDRYKIKGHDLDAKRVGNRIDDIILSYEGLIEEGEDE